MRQNQPARTRMVRANHPLSRSPFPLIAPHLQIICFNAKTGHTEKCILLLPMQSVRATNCSFAILKVFYLLSFIVETKKNNMNLFIANKCNFITLKLHTKNKKEFFFLFFLMIVCTRSTMLR